MKEIYLRIDHDHPITKDSDPEFLYHLQHGILLELKEQGIISEMQYRNAQEQLLKRFNWSQFST